MEDFVIYNNDGTEKKSIYGNKMNPPQNRNDNFQSSDLEFEDSLAMVSYPQYILDFIKKFILDNYSNNDLAQVFMIPNKDGENIYVIEYSLLIELNNRFYKVFVLVYLPLLFPNYPPDFYIEKTTTNISLNKFYLDGKIGPEDFKINLERFVKFDPDKNNIGEIIDNLMINFSQEFPVYKDNSGNNANFKNDSKCFFDKSNANKIKIPKQPKNNSNHNQRIKDFKSNEKNNFDNIKCVKLNEEKKVPFFDDKSFLEYIRKQTKDIIEYNYVEFTQKYNIKGNLDSLKNLYNNSQKGINNDNLFRKNAQLKSQVQALINIKKQLENIENIVGQELLDCQNNKKKSFFEKCDSIVNIPNKQDMEYLIQIRVMEDYLVYLKKAFEKKLLGFDVLLNLTRSLSREIFKLNYARSNIKK